MILEDFYKKTKEEVNKMEETLKEVYCDNEGRSTIQLEVVEMYAPTKKGILMSGYFHK